MQLCLMHILHICGLNIMSICDPDSGASELLYYLICPIMLKAGSQFLLDKICTK